MIRILLVDDHQLVREGLKIYLATEPGIEVAGEAADGETAAVMAAELQPDVILMDLMMPGMNGVEATRRCLVESPAAKVIILTSKAEDDLVLPALRAGAFSYLLKDVSAEELTAAIKDAAVGKPAYHPIAASRILTELSSSDKPGPHTVEISPREMEVLALIAQGLDNKEIGERLFIAERTVKSHVSSLLEKLELRDRTQLAIYAMQNGVVDRRD